MTFPAIGTKANAAIASNVTWTITLPGSRSVGDLLLCMLAANGTTTHPTPTGWTVLYNNGGASTDFWVWARYVDGSEGATITSTAGAARSAGCCFYRLTGTDGTTMPEISVGSAFTSATVDPPSLTPSWGAADDFWLCGWASGDTRTVATPPTNYAAEDSQFSGGSNAEMVVFSRNLNATSDDPPSFTASGLVSNGHAYTLAIRPGSGAAPNTSNFFMVM